MLEAHEVATTIIVDLNEVGTPQRDHGETAGQEKVDGSPQALRPSFDRPKRRRGPVLGADTLRHLVGPVRPSSCFGFGVHFSLPRRLRSASRSMRKGLN